MSLSSPPTQTPVTRLGVRPINQPSELFWVVPVFPPILPRRLYLERKRIAVPVLTTP